VIHYRCSECDIEIETYDEVGNTDEECPACGCVNRIPYSKQQLKILKNKEKEKKRQILEKQKQKEQIESAIHESKKDQARKQHNKEERQRKLEDLKRHEEVKKVTTMYEKEVPDYLFAKIMSWLFLVIGGVIMVGGTIWGIMLYSDGDKQTAEIIIAGAIVSGIMCIGMGGFIECVRDTARNSFQQVVLLGKLAIREDTE